MPRHVGAAIYTALLLATSSAPSFSGPYPSEIAFGDDGGISVALTDVAGDAAAGAAIYADRSSGNCVACHVISGREDATFQGTIGPSLDGAGDRWDTAQLRGIVVDAKQMFPESMMPSFHKSSGYIRPGDAFTGKAGAEPLPPLLMAQQVEDVVAYLATLKE